MAILIILLRTVSVLAFGKADSLKAALANPDDRNGSWLCENGESETALRKHSLQMGS
jgi:hypothetical protein